MFRGISLAGLMVISAAGLFADDSALRGRTAMSAYASVYGVTKEVDAVAVRLALERQLHELGITVLPHGDPPNYPVLNLKIDAKQLQRDDTVRSGPIGSPERRVQILEVMYTNTIELRDRGDTLVWSKSAGTKTVSNVMAWTIGDEALQLAIGFAQTWRAVNGVHPPTPENPTVRIAPPPADSNPGAPLHANQIGACEKRTAGGCVTPVSFGVVGELYDLASSQRGLVQKQFAELRAAGQEVLTCEYGPTNRQTNRGFYVYKFWYKVVPRNILELLTSTYNNPLMELGRVAVDNCPANQTQADNIYAQRLN